MSYILDALKRSEEKRGAGFAAPNLMVTVPSQPLQHRRFVWLLLFGGLLLILGWQMIQWQSGDSNQGIEVQRVASKTAESEGVREPQTAPHPTLIRPAEAIASLPQTPVTHPVQSSRVKSVVHIQKDKPMFKSVRSMSPVSRMNTAHVAETSVRDTVPDVPSNTRSIFELSPAEQQSMPKITIEGHIYDAEPQARMVIINGKVRKENQFVSDGLMLQEITPDGVILDYHGKVFHLGVFDH